MREDDRDNLAARFQRNAPEVDVRGDWATVHGRIRESSKKRPRRNARFLLVSGATICVIAALVVGAVLALGSLGPGHSPIVFGDAPTAGSPRTTVSTGSETTVTTEFQVGAGSLSAAWLKLGEVVGFDVAHANSDELEIDYTPAGELTQVYIHAWVFIQGYTGIGEVTARSTSVGPQIELSVTLTKSDASAAHGIDSQPVISILSALEAVDVKEMIATFAHAKPDDAYELYRLTTAWGLSKREAIEPKEMAYIWHPGSSFSELPPNDELRKASLPTYVHLVMLGYPRDVASTPTSTVPESLARIYFVLPVPRAAGSDAGSENTSTTAGQGVAGTETSVEASPSSTTQSAMETSAPAEATATSETTISP
jgi:hypothetical protein